jgi:predicted RND superfamily exporter protein
MKVYAYIHPELKILCCALLKESVPKGVEIQEFDVEDVNDVIYDGNQIRLKTIEEKLNERKQYILQRLDSKIANLLSKTDYVINKLNDLEIQIKLQNITQNEYNIQLNKYQEALQQRKAIRDWANIIKNLLNFVCDLETLKQFEIIIENYNGE